MCIYVFKFGYFKNQNIKHHTHLQTVDARIDLDAKYKCLLFFIIFFKKKVNLDIGFFLDLELLLSIVSSLY